VIKTGECSMAKEKDEFMEYAEQMAREEAEKAARKAAGGGSFEFERIKWSGLEKGKLKIVRALGGTPNSGADSSTSRTVRVAKIIADNGKVIKVHFPTNDPDYILTRILERVCEVDWVKVGEKNTKVYIQEKKNPDIFNMIMYNGLEASNPKRKFGVEGRGWGGKEMFLMNVLDRDPTVYAWSRENKHCVLLSKNIATIKTDDGKLLEFADDGIPAYGFTNVLAMNIFRHYGDWRNYDIGIERTGQTNPPLRVINAGKYIEEVPEELRDFVVTGPLTAEEKSWETYDLDKLYGPTSATKLWNRLNLSVAKIDAALGSHYLDELKSAADMEATQRDAAKAEKEDEADEEPSNNSEVAARPLTLSEGPSIEVKTLGTSKELLPGWSVLSEEEKEGIVSCVAPSERGGKTWKVTYASDEKQWSCPECKTVAPASYKHCPGCAFAF